MQVPAINTQEATLDVAFLEKGMYFLKVVTEDGTQKTKKFVKN